MGTCISRDAETLSFDIREMLRLLWSDLQYFNKVLSLNQFLASGSLLFFKDPSMRVKFESLRTDFQELARVSKKLSLPLINQILAALDAICSYLNSRQPCLTNFKWHLEVFLDTSSNFL